MDNNNPVNQVPQPTGATTTPPSNIVQNSPVGGEETPKSSKKMILMLVAGLVIAVVLIGGAYFYVNSRGTDQSKVQTPPQTQDVLETELNRVNVEDLETEFATVEADLQNL